MPHTMTREQLEQKMEQGAVQGLDMVSANLWWCQGRGRYQTVIRLLEADVCSGCDHPLTHPNHAWSRKRMERDKEANDRAS